MTSATVVTEGLREGILCLAPEWWTVDQGVAIQMAIKTIFRQPALLKEMLRSHVGFLLQLHFAHWFDDKPALVC